MAFARSRTLVRSDIPDLALCFSGLDKSFGISDSPLRSGALVVNESVNDTLGLELNEENPGGSYSEASPYSSTR